MTLTTITLGDMQYALTLSELVTLHKRVGLAIKTLKPKRPKPPKVRKQRTTEERERARAYAEFLRDKCDRCWICDRTANDRPDWWTSPVFMVERMHVVNSPRVEDVRVIIGGCSLCHRIEHGDRFPECSQRPVGIEVLLAIKRDFDPNNYDPEFLQKHSVKKLTFPATRYGVER